MNVETIRYSNELGKKDTRYESRASTLTVGELKDMLANVPDDYLVHSEGCDCTGEAQGILVSAGEKQVLVERA